MNVGTTSMLRPSSNSARNENGAMGAMTSNDAVEKPHSEILFQLWVDYFQTKPLSSFSASRFSKIFPLQTCLIWQAYSCDAEARIPYSASLSRITMIRLLLDIQCV